MKVQFNESNLPKYIHLIGKKLGHYTDKFNRAQKLVNDWKPLKAKMERIATRGKCKTPASRMAYATLLMMETGIRIGNEGSADGYVSQNKYSEHFNKKVKTYGCTTLLTEHVYFYKGQIRLAFLGKKQVDIFVTSDNPVLVKFGKIMLKRRKIQGIDSFLRITDYELGKFIRKYVGKKFQPKDIRTACVNRWFILLLKEVIDPAPKTKSAINKILKQTLVQTAELAGHTAGVCKSKYVSPKLFNNYKDTLISKYLKKV